MSYRRIATALQGALLLIMLLVSGCDVTKNLKEDQYLLRSNTVKIKSKVPVTDKSEIKDNLQALVLQRPNTEVLGFPYKLWLYNTRAEKFKADSANFQIESKTVEPPVLYDSNFNRRSIINMKGYMFNHGYFYAQITDTSILKNKKAYVTYNVEPGINYLINKIIINGGDSIMRGIIDAEMRNTYLVRGQEFTYSLLAQEQSRLTSVLRNAGYYKFSNLNTSFVIDTLEKGYAKDVEQNVFEQAADLVTLRGNEKKRTLNVIVNIRTDESPAEFQRYGIKRVRVFADYIGRGDFRDSTMRQTVVDGVIFRYHKYWVRENVLLRHIFLLPQTYYSQADYDLTISKLNELGIFSSVRVSFNEDTTHTQEGNWVNCNIFLSPSNQYEFSYGFEVSTGNTYAAGSALAVTSRNRNAFKGGNLITASVSTGIEYFYDTVGDNSLSLLSRTYGLNMSLDMPKFLLPVKQSLIPRRNAPRTVIALGVNKVDRVQYFNLVNTSSSLTYKWQETQTKRWEVTPAFINIINLPYESDSFRKRKESNVFLANSYKPTFVEGENITFIFTDRMKKPGRGYNYVKLGIEEAGGLVTVFKKITGLEGQNYAQYIKFDFDAQHFFVQRHSTEAFRFYGGIGIPYGQSLTLPYIKQYFVGGAYSIRGWRVRSLGPGSFRDTTQNATNQVIDRTGDIKLEWNGEFRFDIFSLFSRAINLKGAVFMDAGNIWLAKKSAGAFQGEFALKYLYDDLAISTGAGLRLDIAGFFIVRFDVGVPLKQPTRSSSGWVANQLFSYKGWGKDNLVPQFGIGYPF